MLSAEFSAVHSPVAKAAPEQVFGVGRFLSEFACELDEIDLLLRDLLTDAFEPGEHDGVENAISRVNESRLKTGSVAVYGRPLTLTLSPKGRGNLKLSLYLTRDRQKRSLLRGAGE
jgi:hypothetical protein